MKTSRRFDRTSPTTVISTVVVLAAMVIALLALLIFAPTSSAGPAEDCAAVRARDHQIYLNLIASLPPGAPIPPEYINPCLTAAPTTTTAVPTTTVGLPGAQAPGGGPNVGANAPTNFPTYNGTPIVPVPTIEVPPVASESPTSETGAGAFPDASKPQVPSPTSTLNPTPGEGTTTDRGPGPVPTSAPDSVPAQSESTPAATTSGLDDDNGRDRYLELVLVGAAAFTAGGIGVRGRRSPFGPRTPLNGRTPESVLSQGVGTLASPLMQYAKGGQSKITVTEPDGGRRTFFLIHDATSSHEAEIPVDVPPGGHMNVNSDGSVTVFDADGNTVSVVAAPWAYDANGNPVPTDYEVRDGRLIQKVYADEATAYPILADPPDKKVKAPASVASKQVTKSSNTTSKPNSATPRTSPQKPQSGNTNSGNTSGGNTSAPNSMTPRTSPQKPQNSGNTNSGNTSGGDTSAPNSMTPRTSPQTPAVSAEQQATNQLAAAHGEAPSGTGTSDAPNSMTPRTTPQKPQNSGNTNSGNTSGGNRSAPNSMTPRTSPQKPAVSAEQHAANQLAAAHGDVPDGFTGNVPLASNSDQGAPNSMTSRTSPHSPTGYIPHFPPSSEPLGSPFYVPPPKADEKALAESFANHGGWLTQVLSGREQGIYVGAATAAMSVMRSNGNNQSADMIDHYFNGGGSPYQLSPERVAEIMSGTGAGLPTDATAPADFVNAQRQLAVEQAVQAARENPDLIGQPIPYRSGWNAITASPADPDAVQSINHFNAQYNAVVVVGDADASGVAPIEIRSNTNIADAYDFDHHSWVTPEHSVPGEGVLSQTKGLGVQAVGDLMASANEAGFATPYPVHGETGIVTETGTAQVR
ncbi:hypothetical protein [Rhodococcus sp. WY5]|uniref:hypothetical protein n=1 Tax=Rhodococcus sp. WY5 TaxID=2708349 RepID=UPI0020327A37|nr:hypothetical protein [Rhodococcus sp. WY5]